ncbi:hypothetical protein B0H63DRAFT_465557 [Podospora didyma]|uniref:G-patch domain-containing protein n=1 Tax=Podospora didyma TaxID=330526 RepID=A0AAE0NZ79_9PEZI|nr:hypothetical protein B0H63DRAFT_465557 [Podospora didyma]
MELTGIGSDNDDDIDDIPLQHQRPFGSGLWRRPIAFVPECGDDGEQKEDAPKTVHGQNLGDWYLSLVLPGDEKSASDDSTKASTTGPRICEICQGPFEDDTEEGKMRHHLSLTHQLSIHPPSSIDRSRMGLAYLSKYGWDPDSRQGLGVEQQGILHPIKAKPKISNLGIGIVVPKNLPPQPPKKDPLLDAGKARKQAAEDKRRLERIRQELYRDNKLQKYGLE